MRSPLLLALGGLAVAAIACGARTGLELDAQDGATSGASSSGGATVGPLAVKCSSAMQVGAPTPTRGYCPTRAGQAAFAGPKAPVVAWIAQPYSIIPDPQDYFPAQVVVDASGRSYFALDASPDDIEGGPNRLTALDPSGHVLWSKAFPTPISGLSLGADGTLWMLGIDVLGLAPTGDVVYDLPLGSDVPGATSAGPAAYGDLAIGADGSLFVATSNIDQLPEQNSAVEHVSAEGTILWRFPWTPGDPLASPFILTQDDAVVELSSAAILELDASGAEAWEQSVSAGQSVSDGSGNVYMLVAPGDADASLVVIDPAGNVVHTVPLGLPQLPVEATQLAVAGNGTAVVLIANEVAGTARNTSHVIIAAVDTSRGVLWSTPFDVTLPFDPAESEAHYGLFVDADGTVVVTAGHVMGLDLTSGAVLWTLDAPIDSSCLRPVVLGTGGSLIGTQCDGLVFLARDP